MGKIGVQFCRHMQGIDAKKSKGWKKTSREGLRCA
jgi:hypothetical protein